ncbi:SAM-dependent methyltransferase [Klebsiella pneumoniae]|uniref:SAM-dependent methyltransferase n=1 Tax=Klebsiella pneumoniae TaxID=573 RepID=A0A378FSM8_KLEPN|nr:SAM-dependent methyltransferase [Klebsiella pneumoniae]
MFSSRGGVIIMMDVMSPGHPVRDVWLQTVEALRDTSHVRNYSSGRVVDAGD